MSKPRYDNMTGGVTLQEAGKLLGLVFPADTEKALLTAGLRPCGGTLKSPRFSARHVCELAAIRASRQGQTGGAA